MSGREVLPAQHSCIGLGDSLWPAEPRGTGTSLPVQVPALAQNVEVARA